MPGTKQIFWNFKYNKSTINNSYDYKEQNK